jgi:hypothetical protein
MRRTTLLPSLLALAVALAVISAVALPLAAQEATPTIHDPAAMHAAFVEAIQVNDAEDRMTPRPRGHREPLDLRPCGEGADMV